LRHPKGVATIQVDFDAFTVQELMQEIYAVTEIPPSLQDLKAGYPPHSLTLIPELPLTSLGLSIGEQLIVNTKQPGSGLSSSAGLITSPRGPSAQDSAIFGSGRLPTSQATPIPTSPARVDTSEPDFVETDGGFLIHRIVPDDNSCLFSSIAVVLEQDIRKAQQIRRIVADEIRSDMITWTEAILGLPRNDYISAILKPTSWGGAIELAILANHYHTEIASIDVETGRVDRFTPEAANNSGNRCILIYSGIHYDAVTLAPIKEAPPEFHQTIMAITSSDPNTDPILVAAKQLADKLRQKKAYTNTTTFTLKCEDCGQ